jgi:simple sugar transport system ATP-binding protein
MNLLYGIHQPDAGRILINGRPTEIRRPADAIRAGIALVHQHFSLVPNFSVAENLMLVQHRHIGPVPDKSRFIADVEEMGKLYGLDVNPRAKASELPLGLRQRVEILGGLIRNASALILDEPTTILAPSEVESLFGTLRQIASEGRGVVLITHRLAEVFEIAETFSVMRGGKLIETAPTASSSPRAVATLMVGHTPTDQPSRGGQESASGPPVFEIRDLSVPPDEASPGLKNVSFALRAGEIVGLAGVEGNGQRELVEVIAGLRAPTEGEVVVEGGDLTGVSRRKAAKLGVQVIPEDRQGEGLILRMPLTDNLSLDRVREPEFARGGIWLRMRHVRNFAKRMIDTFAIRTSSEQTPVRMLSGGNQQKVVLARAISTDPRILVAAQPTRGLDVGATQYVLDQLRKSSKAGTAVLFISSDLDQILSVADHILVLYGGRIVGSMAAAEATRERVAVHMSGIGEFSDSATRSEGQS